MVRSAARASYARGGRRRRATHMVSAYGEGEREARGGGIVSSARRRHTRDDVLLPVRTGHSQT
jgi:hypothetical protein